MPLVLRVEGPGTIRYRGSDLPELIEIDDRLTVGRDERNDLVLSDERRGISTEHCRIERIDRDYAVTDRSRNGTFLNDDTVAIGLGKHAPLKAGDVIRIGEFALHVVSVQALMPLPVPEEPHPPPAEAFSEPQVPGPARSMWPPDDGEQPAEDMTFRGVGRNAFADHLRPEASVFVAPAVGRERIPDDWKFPAETPPRDIGRIERPPPADVTKPVGIDKPAPIDDPTEDPASKAVDAMLNICGLTRGDVPDDRLVEVMSRMAHAFRIAVGNLHAMLLARSEAKQEFGAERTMIARLDNNALKFPMDMNAALRTLMMNDMAGFLPAERAVAQAFDDIKAHQVSLLATTQATLQMLVRQLAPGSVTAGMKRGPMAGWVPILAKARAWDRYVELHGSIDDDLAAGDMRMPADMSPRASAPRSADGRPLRRRAKPATPATGSPTS
ncbi:type VI secretion system-associated FHA domain protein TagH (plasmid) [Skermanella sp. TT6]|uniref:Type VI secretion system-associated FHA domain protein TagH n=1 Tax=Skermanella cutis TaxID=2775420 RepID=A0ABX7BFF0_9PROT|nr:type VI secretion system-associated FHA domain protein TagH [Skermanella sp. TT6]QQP93112.1 type VI secretion system-associated FHA domain protein TagH [Skermanella sp. TT6]